MRSASDDTCASMADDLQDPDAGGAAAGPGGSSSMRQIEAALVGLTEAQDDLVSVVQMLRKEILALSQSSGAASSLAQTTAPVPSLPMQVTMRISHDDDDDQEHRPFAAGPPSRRSIRRSSFLSQDQGRPQSVCMRSSVASEEGAMTISCADAGLGFDAERHMSPRDAGGEQPLAKSSVRGPWPGSIQPRILDTGSVQTLSMSASATASQHASSSQRRFRLSKGMSERTSVLSRDLDQVDLQNSRWRFLRDPNSFVHVAWSLSGLAILLIDLTLTPYILAWDLSLEGSLLMLSRISTAFWTLDMCVSFCTGYYSDGELILSLKHTTRRYLTTTFWPDLFVVGCDWFSLLLMLVVSDTGENSGASIRLLRFAKLGRLLRIVVLLRVVRYMRVLSQMAEKVLSENIRLLVTVLSLSVMTVWFNHMMACLWYAVGRYTDSDNGRHWINVFEDDDTNSDQYIAAFHWSLAQVTLGSMDIMCTNSSERVFNIVCLVVGLIIGSTLISTLSASMVELQMANKDRNTKMRTLRQYLLENRVSASVSLAVQQQVSERLRERKRLTEKAVPALAFLSATLRTELRFEIVRPALTKHSFFFYLLCLDARWRDSFCKDAIHFIVLSTKDDLFFPSTEAKAAYLVLKGSIQYSQEQELLGTVIEEPTLAEASDGTWLAEGTLWSLWTHVGKAVATGSCHILAIPPDGFQQCLVGYPEVATTVIEYGRQFHRKITAACPPSSSFPTDLQVPGTAWDGMVTSMDPQVQQAISLAAAEVLAWGSRSSSSRNSRRSSIQGNGMFSALRDEILSGKCIMIMDATGAPVRIAAVIVLNIRRDDGCILAQIGKWEDAVAKPLCELPGIKAEGNELTSDTMRRLLISKMKPLAGVAELMSTEMKVTEKKSREHKVRTKYLRTICNISLQDDFVSPNCTARCPFVEAPDSPHRSEESEDTRHSMFGGIIVEANYASHTSNIEDMLGDQLAGREVHYFRNGEKGAFYAWLSSQEFDHLSSPAGESSLSLWVHALGRPPLEQQEGIMYDM